MIMQKACCCEGVAQQCFMFSFIQNPEVLTSSSGFIFDLTDWVSVVLAADSQIFYLGLILADCKV